MTQQYTSLNDAAFKTEILAPGDLTVWYARGIYDAFSIKPIVTIDTIEKTHIKLGEIAGSENPEEVFVALQAETWSPNGEARELIQGLGLDHTSMSVGDIIQTSSGRLYMVDFVGFKLLP